MPGTERPQPAEGSSVVDPEDFPHGECVSCGSTTWCGATKSTAGIAPVAMRTVRRGERANSCLVRQSRLRRLSTQSEHMANSLVVHTPQEEQRSTRS